MENAIHLQQTASTNTQLEQFFQMKNHAKDGECLTDGFLLWADYQQAGRGRQQNHWHSENSKNLLMSILLYPNLTYTEQFRITEWISLAVSDFLRQNVGLTDCHIKWPNDIYLHDKKAAGILIEHHISHEKVHRSIIGIGLNVNQTAFPEELPNPTSIRLESGREWPVEECAEQIRNRLMERRNQSAEQTHEAYLQRMYLRHVPARFLLVDSGKVLEGCIAGADSKGMLQMEVNGHLRTFELNEIKYLGAL